MGNGPRQVVPGQPAAAPRVGLLTSAGQPATGDGRWQGGILIDPETGAVSYRVEACTIDNAEARAVAARGGTVSWDTYEVGTGIRCSTFGVHGRDWRAQATRALEPAAERQIGEELWTGALAIAGGLPNGYLAAPGSEPLGAHEPLDALGELEEYLAGCGTGQRGMIHATRAVITRWVADNLVRREGAVLLTAFDTVVVGSTGYPGTGPRAVEDEELTAPAQGVWAYATGMVDVRRGPPLIVGDPAATINPDTNDVVVRAEQTALASWDLVCHAAAEITLA